MRALREQRYGAGRRADRRRSAAALRAELARGGGLARPAARLVGAAAAPARGRGSTLRSRRWTTSTTSSSAVRRCSRRGLQPATVPLAKARDLEPDKTSIREALGRAYFRSLQFEEARAEFEAVVERAPTNDFALFCLGRSLMQLGRHAEARKPLALAAQLRPDRRDYRIYRDRARAEAA